MWGGAGRGVVGSPDTPSLTMKLALLLPLAELLSEEKGLWISLSFFAEIRTRTERLGVLKLRGVVLLLSLPSQEVILTAVLFPVDAGWNCSDPPKTGSAVVLRERFPAMSGPLMVSGERREEEEEEVDVAMFASDSGAGFSFGLLLHQRVRRVVGC